MANRRMFSLDVVDTDKFLEMPLSTQALYFHFGMRADDDGFVSSPKRIIKSLCCNEDDLKLLIAKGYLIPFESGVVVISDWNINNWIRPDRKHNTRFEKEKALLDRKSDVYALSGSLQPTDNQLTTECHTEVRLGKDSAGKDKKQCASGNAPREGKSVIDDFFERIWKLYPSKKGKGQVSDAKKKALYEIGYDELSRAIERYKAGLARDGWRKPQNGSTFFNSGYVDYIDANYSEPELTESEEGDRSIYQDEDEYNKLWEELGYK